MQANAQTDTAGSDDSPLVKKFIELLDAKDFAPRPSGNGWSSLCPGHDDHKPSLSINLGRNGRLLVHCHAGCDVGTVLDSLGLNKDFLSGITDTYEYHDENGVLLYQVCRYLPKNFKQRQPDGNGGWNWSVKGVRRVLYRLPELIEAVQRGDTIYICEGEKDVHSMEAHGFVATCNSGGATKEVGDKKWPDTCTESLRGADVVIIADKDSTGRTHAQVVAGKLMGIAKSIRVIELPDVNGSPVKDPADFFSAGGTADELTALVAATPDVGPETQAAIGHPGKISGTSMASKSAATVSVASDAAINSKLPFVVLPSGAVTITECAANLFKFISSSKQLFVRGGAVMTLMKRDDGLLALEILRPSAARSFFEKFARLMAWRQSEDNRPVLKPVTCPQEMADALLQSAEAATLLPRVQGLINCPVLREVDGKLSVAGVGYDEHTQLLVTGGETPPVVELNEAVQELLFLFAEFDFQTGGDRARAIASLITPALKTGDHLKGRAPSDVAEADASQSGKTYRQKIIAAAYNERVSMVTSREGGVGSTDESLNQQLVAGRPFIQFDNFRGRFDSAHLEAFLTAEGSFPCRVPHRGEVTVAPENYFIFLTSNGVDTTRDFANRSNIIRIRKKPAGFAYTKFEEGDLLSRVRKWQPYYLGCIFAVIRAWHARGKPITDETRHDFREWVQIVDWICQNIFGTVPVMDGHQQAQQRVSNPALVWLRSLVLAISESGEMNRILTATDINTICESADIPIPGLRSGADDDKAKKFIGIVMAKLFRDGNKLEVDSFVITRDETLMSRANSADGGSFKSKTYVVTKK